MNNMPKKYSCREDCIYYRSKTINRIGGGVWCWCSNLDFYENCDALGETLNERTQVLCKYCVLPITPKRKWWQRWRRA